MGAGLNVKFNLTTFFTGRIFSQPDPNLTVIIPSLQMAEKQSTYGLTVRNVTSNHRYRRTNVCRRVN
jgi:hypothetical protein